MTSQQILDNSDYIPEKQIVETVHLGRLDPKFKFAEIEIDVLYYKSDEERPNKINIKALIDTGATNSALNLNILSEFVNIKDYTPIKSFGSVGEIQSYEIPNMFIRLRPLMHPDDFFPLPFVKSCNLSNGFEAIIGNDILHMCEFTYNGISGTYVLKFYTQK